MFAEMLYRILTESSEEILRQSMKLFAAPQFAMEPAIIILKFAIRSPIGPHGPMGPHGPCQRIMFAPDSLNGIIKMFAVRACVLKPTIFIMFSQFALVGPIILN